MNTDKIEFKNENHRRLIENWKMRFENPKKVLHDNPYLPCGACDEAIERKKCDLNDDAPHCAFCPIDWTIGEESKSCYNPNSLYSHWLEARNKYILTKNQKELDKFKKLAKEILELVINTWK